MKRVMVNFDDEMGSRVEARAKAEKRSMSAHILRLVEKDIAESPVESAELLSAAEEVGGAQAAVAILRTAKRPKAKRATRTRKEAV